MVINAAINFWFASPVFKEEAEILSFQIGSHTSQQTAEALAALVALRAWHHLWREKPILFRVRSDSISALAGVLKLKTTGRWQTLVARELALDIAASCYEPLAVEHVPGVSNKICDELSRKYQPGVCFKIPQALHGIPETILRERKAEYFKSVALSPGTQTEKQRE